ncbi:MAG: hypothetical protein U0T73_09580 [Chitinophagales bacterium]
MKTWITICAICSWMWSFGQIDTTIWRTEKKMEDNNYILNIPNDWKKVAIIEGTGQEFKFDLTGIGITTTCNSAPVTANFQISRVKGNDMKAAKDLAINDFMVFSDRVQEPNYTYDSSAVIAKTGQTGEMIRTRYYRRSKVSNYCRYFYNVYSEKADAIFMLNLNFQFKDARYDIERSNRFKEYAERVFRNFELR